MTADVEPGPPGLSIAGARATITLRRPAHRNRLHREDLHALQSHLRRIAADDALRVLVLTGQGPAFCAGFHLGQLGQPDAAGTDPQLFEHTVDALAALALPTVARLNGGIHGGATDLALACDFRIGVAGLTLRMPAARLGLHYYPGGLQRAVAPRGGGGAPRRVGVGGAGGAAPRGGGPRPPPRAPPPRGLCAVYPPPGRRPPGAAARARGPLRRQRRPARRAGGPGRAAHAAVSGPLTPAVGVTARREPPGRPRSHPQNG